MGEQRYIQGRLVGKTELDWVRGLIAEHGDWNRKRLARELCRQWGWCNGQGVLKDFAARSFLLKLEAQGEVVLPAVRGWRKQPRAEELALEWAEPEELKGGLQEFSPVRVEVVPAATPAARRWAEHVKRHHYLGLHVGGENVRYLAQDAQGRDLACVLFGAAAWQCAPRDRHLGLTAAQRRAGLQMVANNTRFLILPWVRVPALASHVLGQVARRIDADWQAKYGHGLRWLETFVERGRFAGTCYQAANWECVGQTTGRSCEDRHHTLQVPVKDVYLYQLRR
jgi:hypothetical protein